MPERVAKPRRIDRSEKLDRLLRLKMDFACRPVGYGNDRWANLRVASSPILQKRASEAEHKRLIREVQTDVKGLEFPAEEMAKIIRGWMASDEK